MRRLDKKIGVLLVEDRAATVDVLKLELVALGYEPIVARNGNAAVELAISEAPDLIIMDISLPGLDGFQATAMIRSNPKTSSIPIFAATARALPSDKQECLESGCNGYIAKPFTHLELGAEIKRLLQQ